MNVELKERVIERLGAVIDPETGADVVRSKATPTSESE